VLVSASRRHHRRTQNGSDLRKDEACNSNSEGVALIGTMMNEHVSVWHEKWVISDCMAQTGNTSRINPVKEIVELKNANLHRAAEDQASTLFSVTDSSRFRPRLLAPQIRMSISCATSVISRHNRSTRADRAWNYELGCGMDSTTPVNA
jgi:hypothetical protein